MLEQVGLYPISVAHHHIFPSNMNVPDYICHPIETAISKVMDDIPIAELDVILFLNEHTSNDFICTVVKKSTRIIDDPYLQLSINQKFGGACPPWPPCSSMYVMASRFISVPDKEMEKLIIECQTNLSIVQIILLC